MSRSLDDSDQVARQSLQIRAIRRARSEWKRVVDRPVIVGSSYGYVEFMAPSPDETTEGECPTLERIRINFRGLRPGLIVSGKLRFCPCRHRHP